MNEPICYTQCNGEKHVELEKYLIVIHRLNILEEVLEAQRKTMCELNEELDAVKRHPYTAKYR